ncbi:class II aldolase/adducin family protein [Bacillus sp. Marseille-P3661]|uniref:class II aldolase/adducin family protein n=1 Tax=Bacillus sp. Marseille-P3661 TaxID=1936234 RepID=UPI000C8312DA|nr:class II aldolase/adducin family protein [Bacillus sp. Marseille-P3661]
MQIKKDIVHYAKLMDKSGLVVGTAGNISARIGDRMYITPSALPYDEMTEEDVLEVDLNTGNVISGHRKPSSETPMHSFIYKNNISIEAIVHTHSTYATMFACANIAIPPVHYTIADIGREVSVAPYATYGSEQLAINAVNTLGDSNGVLLANHGVVAVGSTLKDAYRRAEVIEEVAILAYGSFTLKSVKPLTTENLDDALEGFKTYVSG